MDERVQTRGIRVMHVEDHAGFRVLIKNLLNSQSDMEVVAQAASLDEARARVAGSEIDVAVLDLSTSLVKRGGLRHHFHVRLAVKQVLYENPDVCVLILSANLDPA